MRMLSHRSPRKLFPLSPEHSPLHPSYDVSCGRERLEALARNGGVFGVFFYTGEGDYTFTETVGDVVADIEYLLDLIGPRHVGLGSDLYGLHLAPAGLEDISKIGMITQGLVQRGHSDEVILKILGGNLLRVFEQVWKE